jgi:hypothetical protein
MSFADLIGQVTSLKVYDLGQPYFNGMPVHPEDPPFSMVIYRYHPFTGGSSRRWLRASRTRWS